MERDIKDRIKSLNVNTGSSGVFHYLYQSRSMVSRCFMRANLCRSLDLRASFPALEDA